jgi:ribosome-binding protein aMBF1 (putative translation factor)
MDQGDEKMKSCKKCFHNEVCPHLKDSDAEKCKQFADKDTYVRVIRRKKHISHTKKTIGQIIYEKRNAKRWTQAKLGEKIDSCGNTVAAWEGGYSYPNALFLVSMADVFECSIDEICGRE